MKKTALSKADKEAARVEAEQKEQALAVALMYSLMGIDLARVPVVTTERINDRKTLAAMGRELFKTLKLKGVSFTSPNYSMAQAVHVAVPRQRKLIAPETECPLVKRDNFEVSQKIQAILDVAFPGCNNRSDSQSDHFDYKWSVSMGL